MRRQVIARMSVTMIVLAGVYCAAHNAVWRGASAAHPRSQWNIPVATPVLGDPTGTSPNVHYVTWANVNRWDAQILIAAARFKVPPEYLKAIIAKESGGYWVDPKTGTIIQNPDSHATGLVQAMQDVGNEQLARTLGLPDGYTDPAQNIMLGAAILAEKHDIALSLGDSGETAWQVATGGYFGVWPATMDVTDATGTSGTQYVSDVIGMVDEIRAAAAGSAGTPTP